MRLRLELLRLHLRRPALWRRREARVAPEAVAGRCGSASCRERDALPLAGLVALAADVSRGLLRRRRRREAMVARRLQNEVEATRGAAAAATSGTAGRVSGRARGDGDGGDDDGSPAGPETAAEPEAEAEAQEAAAAAAVAVRAGPAAAATCWAGGSGAGAQQRRGEGEEAAGVRGCRRSAGADVTRSMRRRQQHQRTTPRQARCTASHQLMLRSASSRTAPPALIDR